MSIYVDVVFFINMIMNIVILLITTWLARFSIVWWRVLLAACWGAVYVIFSMLPQLSLLYSPLAKLLVSVSIIIICFGFKNLKTLVWQIGIFYITSFILGGAVLGWLFFWHAHSPYLKLSNITPPTLILLFTSSSFCLVVLFMLAKFVLNRMLNVHKLYHTEARYKDKSVAFTAMLDTGNSLYTILGRRPVVLVDQTTIEKIVTDCVARFLHECPSEKVFECLEECGDAEWLSRVQVIPYRAIGSSNLILGFRPDGLSIKTEDGIIETDNVVLGLYCGNLSNSGLYQALLHPAILKV